MGSEEIHIQTNKRSEKEGKSDPSGRFPHSIRNSRSSQLESCQRRARSTDRPSSSPQRRRNWKCCLFSTITRTTISQVLSWHSNRDTLTMLFQNLQRRGVVAATRIQQWVVYKYEIVPSDGVKKGSFNDAKELCHRPSVASGCLWWFDDSFFDSHGVDVLLATTVLEPCALDCDIFDY